MANKKNDLIVIGIVCVVVVVIALLIALLAPRIRETLKSATPPNPEVTSKSASTGYEGLDYTLYINATVFNHGGNGHVIVWAQAFQGESSWKKAQTVYMSPSESADLTFTFKEISFWSSGSCYYRVWCEV